MWLGGLQAFPFFGKPKESARLARVRNLERDPRFSLLLDAYDDDWSRLWWLRVEGEAVIETGAGLEASSAAQALREKYPQYEEVPLFRGEPQLLKLTPHEHRAWAHRGMDWLAHEIANLATESK